MVDDHSIGHRLSAAFADTICEDMARICAADNDQRIAIIQDPPQAQLPLTDSAVRAQLWRFRVMSRTNVV